MKPGVNFVHPADAGRYYAGKLVYLERPRWWVRMLRWLTGSTDGCAVVKRVNYDAGVIELGDEL